MNSLLQPDFLLSIRFFDTQCRKSCLEPEKARMLAVLEDAIACIQQGNRWFREAAERIVNRRWLFSFNNICETLRLDRASLRLALTDMVTRRSAESYNTKRRKSHEPIERRKAREQIGRSVALHSQHYKDKAMAPYREDRMNYIKNILLVYDSKTDNRALFGKAVWLGQRNQARLNVVNIVEEAPPKVVEPIRPEPADSHGPGIDIIEEFPHDISMPVRSDAHQHETETAEESSLDIQEQMIQAEKPKPSLDEFVTGIRQAGVQVSSKTFYGRPFLEIIREVLRNRHDLVMITAEGGSSLKQILFGSTTRHLMRKCPCPVWAIRPGQAKQDGPILAAVDVSLASAEWDELNSSIVDMAASLARMQHSELFIIHTWTMCGESPLRRRRGMLLKEEVDEMVRETRDAHRQALTELLRRHSLKDLKHQVYMLKGEAGILIPQLAKKKEVKVIVMGTVSGGGIAGLLIGNSPEKVLQQVDCSVLTVKTEGFLAP